MDGVAIFGQNLVKIDTQIEKQVSQVDRAAFLFQRCNIEKYAYANNDT